MPLVVAILACLAVATTFGFLNGIIITKAKLPPFIVTLAIGIMARSITMYFCRGATIMGNNIPQFTQIGNGSLFGIVPYPFIVAMVIAVAFHVILTRSKFGTYVFAVGGNQNAAMYSGIKVDRIKIATYMIVGLCTGVAATLEMSRMVAVAAASSGSQYEFEAITAVIVGGTVARRRPGPHRRHHRRVHHSGHRQQHDDHAQYIALPLGGREGGRHPLRGAHAEAGAVLRIHLSRRRAT